MINDYAQHWTPTPERPSWRPWLAVFLSALALAFLADGFLKHIGTGTFTVANNLSALTIRNPDQTPRPEVTPIGKDPDYALPENDKQRLDILILGIRGKDDVENGGLLTDTILMFSFIPETKTASLVSIPRDLAVRITDERRGKINEVYAHYGVGETKKLFSRIFGVWVDHAVVVDFKAFEGIVDALGGVSITLDQPFSEKDQWGYEFSLPKGPNDLTGEQALYYVRSRYSSSDFDRSRRQMQVLVAIKNKAVGLNLLEDPLTILQVLGTIRSHVVTDLGIFDIGTLKQLAAQGGQLEKIRRYQITSDNLVYETKESGLFELRPAGDSFARIKEFMRTVLDPHPVLWTPQPTPTTSVRP